MGRNRNKTNVTKLKTEPGYDSQGKPVVAFVGKGRTGLNQYSGRLNEEFHKDLEGTKGVKVYREMLDNHAIIATAFKLLRLIAQRTEYTIEAAKDPEGNTREDPAALEAKRLVETAFADIKGGLEGAMGEAMSSLAFGWAVMEKIYKLRRGEHPSKHLSSKYNDGRIGWRKFGVRSQESLDRWIYDDEENVVGFVQIPPPSFRQIEIPMSKLLHFVPFPWKESPEGKSVLRGIYVSYYYQTRHEEIEAIGYDRNLAGFPKMSVPPEVLEDTNGATLNDYKRLVSNVRTDSQAGVIVPAEQVGDEITGYKFELIASGGRDLAASDTVVRRYRAEVAMGLMHQFMLVAIDGTGAYSAIEGHNDAHAIFVEGVLDTLLMPFNDDAIPELLAINGMSRSDAPMVKRGNVQKEALGELASYLGTMASSGFIQPDDELENRLRKAADLPALSSDGSRDIGKPVTAAKDPSKAIIGKIEYGKYGEYKPE